MLSMLEALVAIFGPQLLEERHTGDFFQARFFRFGEAHAAFQERLVSVVDQPLAEDVDRRVTRNEPAQLGVRRQHFVNAFTALETGIEALAATFALRPASSLIAFEMKRLQVL